MTHFPTLVSILIVFITTPVLGEQHRYCLDVFDSTDYCETDTETSIIQLTIELQDACSLPVLDASYEPQVDNFGTSWQELWPEYPDVSAEGGRYHRVRYDEDAEKLLRSNVTTLQDMSKIASETCGIDEFVGMKPNGKCVKAVDKSRAAKLTKGMCSRSNGRNTTNSICMLLLIWFSVNLGYMGSGFHK